MKMNTADKSNILGSLMRPPSSDINNNNNCPRGGGGGGGDNDDSNKENRNNGARSAAAAATAARPTSGISASSIQSSKHKLSKRFTVIKKLGKGTYGKVQLAINKQTGQEVAIKTIKKSKIENEEDMQRVRREIQIMRSIEHPHIIHIYEEFENKDKIVLIMQYAPGGELYEHVSQSKVLDDQEARRLFRQIATAIYYCHHNKICHRDLKLENILLDEKNNAKLADFGLSNVFDKERQLRTFCGSPLYASPEIVRGSPYEGPEVDCWSLGVLLYTLVYGAMPFDGSNFKRLVKQISDATYYEPSQKSAASPLIRRLLCADPNKRATIVDICSDPWVNGATHLAQQPLSPKQPAQPAQQQAQPQQQHHCLLKVAQDMANLTPVRVDMLLALTMGEQAARERRQSAEAAAANRQEAPAAKSPAAREDSADHQQPKPKPHQTMRVSPQQLDAMEVDSEARATSPVASYIVRDLEPTELPEPPPPPPAPAADEKRHSPNEIETITSRQAVEAIKQATEEQAEVSVEQQQQQQQNSHPADRLQAARVEETTAEIAGLDSTEPEMGRRPSSQPEAAADDKRAPLALGEEMMDEEPQEQVELTVEQDYEQPEVMTIGGGGEQLDKETAAVVEMEIEQRPAAAGELAETRVKADEQIETQASAKEAEERASPADMNTDTIGQISQTEVAANVDAVAAAAAAAAPEGADAPKPKKVKKKIVVVKKRKKVAKKDDGGGDSAAVPAAQTEIKDKSAPRDEDDNVAVNDNGQPCGTNQEVPTDNKATTTMNQPSSKPGRVRIPNTFQSDEQQQQQQQQQPPAPSSKGPLEVRRQSALIADVSQKLLQTAHDQKPTANIIESDQLQLKNVRVSDKKEELERRASLLLEQPGPLNASAASPSANSAAAGQQQQQQQQQQQVATATATAESQMMISQSELARKLQLMSSDSHLGHSESVLDAVRSSCQPASLVLREQPLEQQLQPQQQPQQQLQPPAGDERSDSLETIRAENGQHEGGPRKGSVRSSFQIDLSPLRDVCPELLLCEPRQQQPAAAAAAAAATTTPTTTAAAAATTVAAGPAPIARSYKKVTFTKDGACVTETGRIYSTQARDGTLRRVERKSKVTHYPAAGSEPASSLLEGSPFHEQEEIESTTSGGGGGGGRRKRSSHLERLIMPAPFGDSDSNDESATVDPEDDFFHSRASSLFFRTSDQQQQQQHRRSDRAGSASSGSSGSTDVLEDIFDSWTGAISMFNNRAPFGGSLFDRAASRLSSGSFGRPHHAANHRRRQPSGGGHGLQAATPRCESVEPTTRGQQQHRQSAASGYESDAAGERGSHRRAHHRPASATGGGGGGHRSIRAAGLFGSWNLLNELDDHDLMLADQPDRFAFGRRRKSPSSSSASRPARDLGEQQPFGQQPEEQRSQLLDPFEIFEREQRNLRLRLARQHKQLWQGSSPSLFDDFPPQPPPASSSGRRPPSIDPRLPTGSGQQRANHGHGQGQSIDQSQSSSSFKGADQERRQQQRSSRGTSMAPATPLEPAPIRRNTTNFSPMVGKSISKTSITRSTAQLTTTTTAASDNTTSGATSTSTTPAAAAAAASANGAARSIVSTQETSRAASFIELKRTSSSLGVGGCSTKAAAAAATTTKATASRLIKSGSQALERQENRSTSSSYWNNRETPPPFEAAGAAASGPPSSSLAEQLAMPLSGGGGGDGDGDGRESIDRRVQSWLQESSGNLSATSSGSKSSASASLTDSLHSGRRATTGAAAAAASQSADPFENLYGSLWQTSASSKQSSRTKMTESSSTMGLPPAQCRQAMPPSAAAAAAATAQQDAASLVQQQQQSQLRHSTSSKVVVVVSKQSKMLTSEQLIRHVDSNQQLAAQQESLLSCSSAAAASSLVRDTSVSKSSSATMRHRKSPTIPQADEFAMGGLSSSSLLLSTPPPGRLIMPQQSQPQPQTPGSATTREQSKWGATECSSSRVLSDDLDLDSLSGDLESPSSSSLLDQLKARGYRSMINKRMVASAGQQQQQQQQVLNTDSMSSVGSSSATKFYTTSGQQPGTPSTPSGKTSAATTTKRTITRTIVQESYTHRSSKKGPLEHEDDDDDDDDGNDFQTRAAKDQNEHQQQPIDGCGDEAQDQKGRPEECQREANNTDNQPQLNVDLDAGAKSVQPSEKPGPDSLNCQQNGDTAESSKQEPSPEQQNGVPKEEEEDDDDDEDVREAKASIKCHLDRMKETELFLKSLKQEEENFARQRQQMSLFNDLCLMGTPKLSNGFMKQSYGHANPITTDSITVGDLYGKNSSGLRSAPVRSYCSLIGEQSNGFLNSSAALSFEPTYVLPRSSNSNHYGLPPPPPDSMDSVPMRPSFPVVDPLEPVQPLFKTGGGKGALGFSPPVLSYSSQAPLADRFRRSRSQLSDQFSDFKRRSTNPLLDTTTTTTNRASPIISGASNDVYYPSRAKRSLSQLRYSSTNRLSQPVAVSEYKSAYGGSVAACRDVSPATPSPPPGESAIANVRPSNRASNSHRRGDNGNEDDDDDDDGDDDDDDMKAYRASSYVPKVVPTMTRGRTSEKRRSYTESARSFNYDDEADDQRSRHHLDRHRRISLQAGQSRIDHPKELEAAAAAAAARGERTTATDSSSIGRRRLSSTSEPAAAAQLGENSRLSELELRIKENKRRREELLAGKSSPEPKAAAAADSQAGPSSSLRRERSRRDSSPASSPIRVSAVNRVGRPSRLESMEARIKRKSYCVRVGDCSPERPSRPAGGGQMSLEKWRQSGSQLGASSSSPRNSLTGAGALSNLLLLANDTSGDTKYSKRRSSIVSAANDANNDDE